MLFSDIVGGVVDDGIKWPLRWINRWDGATGKETGHGATGRQTAFEEAGKVSQRPAGLLAKAFDRARRNDSVARERSKGVLCCLVVVGDFCAIRTGGSPETSNAFGPFKCTDEPNGTGGFDSQWRGET